MNFVIKPTVFLNIAMGLIFSLFLLSCARTSNSQQNEMAPLVATTKILDVSVQDTISVQVEFTLKNMTANNLEVLKWGTPFEGEFNDDMFEVQVNGKQVRYLGIQIKRGAPQPEDFISLAPHGVVSASVFLEKGYDLSEPGQYSVQYSKPYVSVRSNGSDAQLVQVNTHPVVFTISK